LDPDEDGSGNNDGKAISGLAATSGLLIASFQGTDDVMRAHTPTGDYDGGTKLQWFNLGWVIVNNTANAARGDGIMDQGGEDTVTFSLMGSGLLAVPTSATSFTWFAVDTGNDQVRSYTDVLLAAPTVTGPADESSRTSAPTLSWAPFTALTSADFMVRLSTDPTFADVLRTSYTPVTAPNTFSLSTTGLTPGFGSGNTYYWQVAATTATTASPDGTTQDVQSPWSSMRSYIAAAGLPGLLFPVSAPGLRQSIPSTTPGLSWTAVGAAINYRVQIATDPTVVSSAGSYVTPILTREVGSATPALQLVAGDLQPGTIYYWQVQALFASNAAGNYTSLGPPPFQGGTSSNSGVFQTPGPVAPPVVVPDDPGPVAVFAEVIAADPAVQIVGYNGATGAFQFFDASLPAGHPANDLVAVQPGDGVWMFNSTAANITVTILRRSHTLVPGWNLRGL
jgi:hypothetical protein